MTSSGRSYKQFCGLARALDVVGERWTLLIVRELLLGPQRYSELLGSLPGLTTNLLAARLQSMERLELVERVEDDGIVRYRLTSSGAALEPVVMELARWGGRYLGTPRRGDRLDIGWALLSLKRRYRGNLDLMLGVDVAGQWFSLGFESKSLCVQRGRPVRSPVSLHGSTETVRGLLMTMTPLDTLLASQALAIDGDVGLVRAALDTLLPPEYAHMPRP